jgi:hypothetical protein
MPNDSKIQYDKDGQAIGFHGKDAVEVFRVATLASSIKMFGRTGMMPTRGMTGAKMLKMAEQYTGKKYKRGQYEQAAADLSTWVQTMKAALPSETRE